jgi:hypothetical protein
MPKLGTLKDRTVGRKPKQRLYMKNATTMRIITSVGRQGTVDLLINLDRFKKDLQRNGNISSSLYSKRHQILLIVTHLGLQGLFLCIWLVTVFLISI